MLNRGVNAFVCAGKILKYNKKNGRNAPIINIKSRAAVGLQLFTLMIMREPGMN